VPNPGYPAYSAVAQLTGATLRYYALEESKNWQADLELLAKTDLSKVKLMWINYPNMPTGAPADMAYFTALVQFAKQYHILLVNDNPYTFVLNPEKHSLLSVPGAMDVALELNSLSKIFLFDSFYSYVECNINKLITSTNENRKLFSKLT
jgi:aspartate/methionine/tyrosine aminotransferase